jgi:DNA polymerase I-like protein with 3'-5' exonuclease and polymerase domains
LEFEFLAVDTEGYAPNILGISVAHPFGISFYYPLGHKEDVNIDAELHDFLRHVLITVKYRIFHNAGHDLNALPYLMDLPFADTMIMAHMIDENIMSKGLDYLSKYYCKNEGKQMHPLMAHIIKHQGWEYVPYALLQDYAATDATITMELFLHFLPLYEEQFGPLWSE